MVTIFGKIKGSEYSFILSAIKYALAYALFNLSVRLDIKKRFKLLQTAFLLVAGTGLEPVTFGL